MISKWLLGLWLQRLQRIATDLWPKVTNFKYACLPRISRGE